MAEIQIPRVDEAWITDKIKNRFDRGKLRRDFKFILAEGPNGLGYVRFNYRGTDHKDILTTLYQDVDTAGQNRNAFVARGGGFAKVVNFGQLLDELVKDFEAGQPSQYTLRFYGDSRDLGRFDAQLLEKTLKE